MLFVIGFIVKSMIFFYELFWLIDKNINLFFIDNF